MSYIYTITKSCAMIFSTITKHFESAKCETEGVLRAILLIRNNKRLMLVFLMFSYQLQEVKGKGLFYSIKFAKMCENPCCQCFIPLRAASSEQLFKGKKKTVK